MKFIKLIRFDIRNGICRNIGLLLAPAVISVLSFVDFSRKFYQLELIEASEVGTVPTYADYIMYIYGGMTQYIPNPANPFQFPAIWMIWFMSLLYFMSSYAYKDMQTVGIQLLTRSGSRLLWWMSKTVWCFIGTLLFHAVIWLTVCIGCMVKKADLTFTLHTDSICRLFQTFSTGSAMGIADIPTIILLLPVVVSFAFSLCQMTLSLFIKPMFSYLAMAVTVILSTYIFSPMLLCNYAMLIRSELFMSNGVNAYTGYAYAAIVVLFLTLFGARVFYSYDVINRE